MEKKSKNTNLENLLKEHPSITDNQIEQIFQISLENVGSIKYEENLKHLFTFGLKNKDLFTNKSVKISGDAEKEILCYFDKWISNYVKDRENKKIEKPLKNYGEKDEALISRVRASTGKDEDIIQYYLEGHYLFMSAENVNGSILEEYLAEVLEPAGWQWCAGSVYRAIDFCYVTDKTTVLLQVKNKYNTENSSSSAIRNGTKIQKWNRLSSPKKGESIPKPNWKALHDIVNNESLNPKLNEKKYLEFIEKNSTTKLDKSKK